MKQNTYRINQHEINVLVGSRIPESSIESLLDIDNIKNAFVIIDADIVNLEPSKKIVNFLSSKMNLKKYLMPAQKQNKTFQTVLEIFSMLERVSFSRDGVIVAIGGGVIGDIAGFVANCWYRGVQLIHVPTTLLSMVDSCYGGKTAINFRTTINAVGTYHHPSKILIDTCFLESLPKRDIASGIAEILKYGLIEANDILDYLSENKLNTITSDFTKLEWLIHKCLKIKHDYVVGDVSEQSKRLALNFGHTIGHAVETASQNSGQENLRHGEAVAIGMNAALWISNKLLNYEKNDIYRFHKICHNMELPYQFDHTYTFPNREAFLAYTEKLVMNDKKRNSRGIRMILLSDNQCWSVLQINEKETIKYGIESIIT